MYDYDLVNFEFDFTEDGYADTYVETIDSNTIAIMTDSTGDGYADTITFAIDTNNSGQPDTFQTYQDVTWNGEADIVAKAHDYNQDGNIDSVTTYTDYNQDGKFDEVQKAYDSTGDGNIDKVDIYTDVTGSGQPDSQITYNIDPHSGILVPEMTAGFEISGTMSDDLQNFEPNESYPSGISGDPTESMNHWEYQGQTNRCAIYSQKFVVEELTGDDIDIEDFTNIAKENGWFTEEGGTTFLNMNNMLDYYGIDNEMSFHKSVDDIENCLNEGGKVIVSIDCHEIWYGEDNNIFSPESSSNHAVEVIGIDRTDPENPMVVLNDSGSPKGKGEMVPLDVFQEAWEDGDCQMIECYA